jgi:Flp pilus assembly pilin Flp
VTVITAQIVRRACWARHGLRRLVQMLRKEDGMTTAEYAVGTVAAVAFGAVLYKVVTSSAVSAALTKIITKALNVSF